MQRAEIQTCEDSREISNAAYSGALNPSLRLLPRTLFERKILGDVIHTVQVRLPVYLQRKMSQARHPARHTGAQVHQRYLHRTLLTLERNLGGDPEDLEHRTPRSRALGGEGLEDLDWEFWRIVDWVVCVNLYEGERLDRREGLENAIPHVVV